jgi:hypothetical protein
MDSFSNWFKEVIFITIPGFIYLLCGFLFLPLEISSYISKGVYEFGDNFLYVFSIIIIASYTVGIVIHWALQRIIWFVYPKYRDELYKLKKSNINEQKLKIIRDAHVMTRHLIISVFCLGWALLSYYLRINKLSYACWFLFICLLFDVILCLAYSYLSILLKEHKRGS